MQLLDEETSVLGLTHFLLQHNTMVSPSAPNRKNPPHTIGSLAKYAVVIGTLGFVLGGVIVGRCGDASITMSAETSLLSLSSPSSEYSTPSSLRQQASLPISSLAKTDSSSLWLNQVAGEGSTSCDEVSSKVSSKEWQDPNTQQVFLREVVTNPHFHVSVHNNEYDPLRYRTIFAKGNYYEHLNRQRFEYCLAESQDVPHPLVVDVGGNIGYYTLLSAAWKHSVVTFEINPANLMRICESLKFNKFTDQVRIQRYGVSDKSDEVLTIEVPSNPGAAGLIGATEGKSEQAATSRSFSVSTISLDDFATRHGWFEQQTNTFLQNWSVWKLDVEGLEATILQGSQKLIQSKLARNILVEYRPKTARPAINLLLEAGYVIVDDQTDKKKKKLLTTQESHEHLDAIYKDAEARNAWKYHDMWFRRAELPLK